MDKKKIRLAVTASIVLVAVLLVTWKYWAYMTNPWTRHGQVRAQVIQITPRVSAPIVNLPIKDNQFVRTGDVLFEIDPRTFEAAVHEAQANLDQAQANVATAQDDANRADDLRARDKGAIPEAQVVARRIALRGAEAAALAAQAALDHANLNLEFTTVRAPVDGYVTNLNLRIGSQAVANTPALALVDVNSYWVHGFFKESVVAGIVPGDEAIVTLMTYRQTPLRGRVESVGWGIAQDDGSTGEDLLPSISPTYEWIRLAQRVPVRVRLVDVPDDVELRVGTTASVLVRKGTADSSTVGRLTATPAPLQ